MLKHDKPFKITTYLNKRQASKTIADHYACYVRVYPYDRNFPTFFVTTNLSCSVEQYDNMFVQARTKLKPTNTKKFNAIMKMVDKAESLNDYTLCRSPQAFKDKWKGVKSEDEAVHGYSSNINDCYKAYIQELTTLEKFGTASSYNSSRNSLTRFFKDINKDFDKLSFYDITEGVLHRYSKHCKDLGNAGSSVGVYLRPLKALFNKAIKLKLIDADHYPFGKDAFKIPKSKKTYKALSSEDLKAFWEYQPTSVARQRSKEIWFLSYFSSGVNYKDLVYLQHSDVKEDKLRFIRAKTEGRSEKIIEVPRNEYINKMLKKHKGKGKYAFNFVDHKLDALARHKRYKDKLRAHNKMIKKIAKQIGATKEVSYQWGRHSFATKSRNDGQDLGMIQQAMGHATLQQTEAYLNSFTDDKMKDLQDNLSNF